MKQGQGQGQGQGQEKRIKNIVDIHNHLLPGVDDGAQSTDESLHYLRTLYAEGVTRLAVSPHVFGWLIKEVGGLGARMDRLSEVFGELEDVCTARTDVPALHFNQEILCSSAAMARAVFEEKRMGVRNSRYALVEFGFDLRSDCTDIVHAVGAAGKRMIVSHPERYRRNGEPISIDEIESWKQAGAYLQINAGSLVGDYGTRVSRAAWHLVHAGLADLIATDHHARSREVSPAAAAKILADRGGSEVARLLMFENPGRVLDDLDLLPVPLLARQPAQ